jgi:CheY-like chemotaxis protein
MARALVVDCDLARGSMIREVVSELGLDVSLALDAFEALDVLRLDERPLLLVTELALPSGRRGDGLSLVRRLRGLSSGKDQTTRVVVLSSSREMRDQASTLRDDLQIDAVLSTAVSRSSLKRVLSGLVPVFTPGGMMRRSGRPRSSPSLPTLASLALDVGADFGLSGLQVATGGSLPVSRCVTPLVSSDQRVLGQLYVASSMRAVDRETLEVIAREVVREFEAARVDRVAALRR